MLPGMIHVKEYLRVLEHTLVGLDILSMCLAAPSILYDFYSIAFCPIIVRKFLDWRRINEIVGYPNMYCTLLSQNFRFEYQHTIFQWLTQTNDVSFDDVWASLS